MAPSRESLEASQKALGDLFAMAQGEFTAAESQGDTRTARKAQEEMTRLASEIGALTAIIEGL